MILKKINKTKLNLNIESINKDKIKILFNEELMVKYLYELLVNKKNKKLKKLCIIYPSEFLMAIYIKTIKGD